MGRTSDHVTMIHDGHVCFDGDLERVKESHLFTQVSFNNALDRTPVFDGVLMVNGAGRSWNMVHESPLDQFSSLVYSAGGEVGESRIATLEEIFIARAGRKVRSSETVLL